MNIKWIFGLFMIFGLFSYDCEAKHKEYIIISKDNVLEYYTTEEADASAYEVVVMCLSLMGFIILWGTLAVVHEYVHGECCHV
ncbi:MAG: hypothetical protein ACRCXT_00555 [Paraclostridium sp.]